MQTQITVAVACYNEDKSIIDTINNLLLALNQIGITFQILVMDDASSDSSIQLVEKYIYTNPNVNITLHKNKINRGLEWNVFKAVEIACGKYFWIVAGDNALDVETYKLMLSNVGKSDIIIPYVLSYRGRKLQRKIISSLYVKIINFLSGHNIKYYNGSSIYNKKDIINHGMDIKGFSYSAELIIRLLDQGKSYIEIPVIFNDRKHGKSSAISLKNFLTVSKFLLRLTRRCFCLSSVKQNAISNH